MSNKVRNKKVVVHKHSFEGGATELLDRMSVFAKEWAEKHNGLSQEHATLKQAAILQFGHVEANDRVFAESLDKIDTNVLAFAKVLRAIYGQLEQTEEFLKIIMDKVGLDPTQLPLNLEEIRERAEGATRMAIMAAFNEVMNEKIAHEEARQKAQAEAMARSTEAAEEAQRAEEGLRDAEVPQLDALTGGIGADIPEGAQVFGE